MNRPNPAPRASSRASSEPGAAAPAAAWTQHKERSSLLMLRVMSWLSLRLGRRLSRPLVYAIAAYFVCFAPTARRASRDYLKRVLPRKPLIVKLSPNVEDITQTARATIDGGAQMISMINTFTAMAIDIHNKRPRLANVTGGLSGPAIKPIALHLISRVYRAVAKSASVPIIGMGGVQTWQDAVEFLLAGSSAVAVGTALFVDPSVPNKICDGLEEYLTRSGVARISDLIGALELPGDEPKAAPYP